MRRSPSLKYQFAIDIQVISTSCGPAGAATAAGSNAPEHDTPMASMMGPSLNLTTSPQGTNLPGASSPAAHRVVHRLRPGFRENMDEIFLRQRLVPRRTEWTLLAAMLAP